MNRKFRFAAFLLAAALLLSGCALQTVDQMYRIPKRSAEFYELQKAIDAVMEGLEYCAPLSGENPQAVQMADLDGDGAEEYLLFAKGTTEKPLQILIFSRAEEGYVLRDTLESHGSGFELVEYVDMDGRPGVELVVGRRVSDQVLRSLSVYSFTPHDTELLMTTNYSKFVATDLDSNGLTELMVITPDSVEGNNGVAALYSWEDGQMTRSREMSLSGVADHIKRIMVGTLHGGHPAVYVATSVDESSIITDVFAMRDGHFTNVSLSNESGTSVQTLRNYYVYADDIDDDGVLELPDLIDMIPYDREKSGSRQYLIRWYAMDLNGGEADKMYTFHDLSAGWYLELDDDWAPRVTVSQSGGSYSFYLWQTSVSAGDRVLADKLFSIEVLTGADREDRARSDNWFPLCRTEGTVYAAKLEAAAESLELTQEQLVNCFRLIFKDWKTGET